LGRRDRSKPREVSAGGVIDANVSAPVRDFRDCIRQMDNRIREERNRRVSGNATRGQFDRTRNLFGCLNGSKFDLTPLPCHLSAFREAVLGVDFREVVIRHELNAEPAAAFLARFPEKNDIAIEWYVESLQRDRRHQRAGDIILVVYSSTPVNVAT